MSYIPLWVTNLTTGLAVYLTQVKQNNLNTRNGLVFWTVHNNFLYTFKGLEFKFKAHTQAQ